MKSSTAVAVAVAVATTLGLPAVAQGAALTAQGSCFASTADIPVTGTGFTPGASVQFQGEDLFARTATADAAGNVAVALRARGDFGPKPVERTVTATETQNPANTAAATFPVIEDALLVEANLNGNPRSVVRWRFAGFRSGEPIYGHFRLRGRTYRNYRFGTARGACGTLSVRARRLPVAKLRFGQWTLQFDQSRQFSTKVPRRKGTLNVFRTFR